jgi:hypothetical protein
VAIHKGAIVDKAEYIFAHQEYLRARDDCVVEYDVAHQFGCHLVGIDECGFGLDSFEFL